MRIKKYENGKFVFARFDANHRVTTWICIDLTVVTACLRLLLCLLLLTHGS